LLTPATYDVTTRLIVAVPLFLFAVVVLIDRPWLTRPWETLNVAAWIVFGLLLLAGLAVGLLGLLGVVDLG